jgi:hypothetical protein
MEASAPRPSVTRAARGGGGWCERDGIFLWPAGHSRCVVWSTARRGWAGRFGLAQRVLTSRMRKECHGELGNAVDASCCATCVPAAFRNPKAPRFLLRVMGSGICSLFVLLCVGLGSFDASSELAKKKLLRCGLVALCLFQKQSSNQDGRSRTCTKLVRKKMWTDLHGTYGHVTDNLTNFESLLGKRIFFLAWQTNLWTSAKQASSRSAKEPNRCEFGPESGILKSFSGPQSTGTTKRKHTILKKNGSTRAYAMGLTRPNQRLFIYLFIYLFYIFFKNIQSNNNFAKLCRRCRLKRRHCNYCFKRDWPLPSFETTVVNNKYPLTWYCSTPNRHFKRQ